MKTSVFRTVWLAALAAGAAASQANLVVNGDFEQGYGDFSGWTLGGNTVTFGVRDKGPHGGALHGAFGPNGSIGLLSQSIATVAGTSYSVSFWLRNDELEADPDSFFSASFGGVTGVTVVDPIDTTWRLYTFDVTAISANTLLSFSMRNDPDYYFLDDVSVVANPIAPGVPGPAAAASFVLMALRRRKRA